MVFSAMGTAFAQSSAALVDRADFIMQLDRSLDIQPVYPATPDFQDVSPSSPYYGYIEAAFQLGIAHGISQGIFGPSLGVTGAQAAKYLVTAYGAAAAVSATSGLGGYFAEAKTLGLTTGITGLAQGVPLTITQEAQLFGNFEKALESEKLQVTPSSTDVAPGQIVTLKTTGTTPSGVPVSPLIETYSVVGSNASDAVVTGDSFAASQPGSYTVQASEDEGNDNDQPIGSAVINVYGPPVALVIIPPLTIVQNGVTPNTITVHVVDKNGNIVGNNNDNICLSTTSTSVGGFSDGLPCGSGVILITPSASPPQHGLVPNGATPSGGLVSNVYTPSSSLPLSLTPDSGDLQAHNGIVTFTWYSGTTPGGTITLNAQDDTSPNTSITGTDTLTGAPQVPTSIGLSPASPYLPANSASGTDALQAWVLDQTGNPMLSGSSPVSFSVTGPGTFSGSATAGGVYYGPSQTTAKATLNDVQGATGRKSVV